MKKLKLHLPRAISQEQCSIWSWSLVHSCKMIVSLGVFFIFSKFWFSVSLCIQDLYQRWFWFLVYTCKMVISSAIFFSFSKFCFGFLGVGQKMTHNFKFQSVTLYLKIISSRFLVYMCKIMLSAGVILIFKQTLHCKY